MAKDIENIQLDNNMRPLGYKMSEESKKKSRN